MEKNIVNELNELNKKRETVQHSFNIVCKTLVGMLANKIPESHFGIYKNPIIMFLEERPSDPIAMFIEYVYSNDEFRQKIKIGDENFFMTQTYDGMVEQSLTPHIFQFKELWTKIDTTMKNIIKSSMLSLVNRTEIYIELSSEINKMKKLLKK